MQFGIVKEDFERQIVSGNTQNTIYHYKGQLWVSDDEDALCADNTVCVSIKDSLGTTLAPMLAFDLIEKQFASYKKLQEEFKERYEINGFTFVADNLTWSTDPDALPVTWYDSLEDAMAHWQPLPHSHKVSQSSPISMVNKD